LVGLCVERSIELILGILGILKAGGAYVPFDPSYPTERLEFMLKDADAPVLVTQTHLSNQLPACDSAVVYLDAEDLKHSSDGDANETNFESATQSGDLAYVIYTSGSTGKPNGVLITHSNVTRLLESIQAWFDFNSSDIWTLFHSYAFDFSVWEIWGALLNGGKLLVVPHTVSLSPEEFASFVKENHITVLNQTPSSFRQLMPHLISIAASERLDLRYVIFGGEALELQSLQSWFDRYGEDAPKLVNMYGITETTVHATYRPITQADTKSRAGSLIGKPIPDLSIYVLDSRQRLQPIGVPGEIYIRGAGLARGYLKRPELTADRFIPDPFSNDSQARLYRSGDRARWLSNGELEYLGRIDDQVKVRGYRIELGEIEAVLRSHPAVRQCAVAARENTADDRRLVAYVVTQHGASMNVGELRNFLKQKLPNYMIPSAWLPVDQLPLTPNGKVDRRALPEPDQNRPDVVDAYQAPRTPLEATLAKIWAELLKLEQVGIHDNFFELGGHSLLATQLISRVRGALRVELPLRALFEAPTIAELSSAIEQIKSEPELEEIARDLAEVESLTTDEIKRQLADED
jgi:amino acid adenylation domain-containing protein